MYGLVLTASKTPIISQIAWVIGQMMNWIYVTLGVHNIGWCIIILTVIVYTLMMPLTYKQQKFSKMSALMNPEIQKIQKKYKGKKDTASMEKQQQEMKFVYDKYGTSPMGGCTTMLVQMPVLFGMYAVIRNVPAYVSSIKDLYQPLAEQIINTSGFQKIMEAIGTVAPVQISANQDYTKVNTIIDVLYKFQSSTWDTFASKMPSLSDMAYQTQASLDKVSNFFGINVFETPWSMLKESISPFAVGGIILAISVPILAGLSQFLSVKLQPQQASVDPDNQMANSMKTMTYMMPLMSVYMCFILPAGLGIYWCISAVVRVVQQLGINKYLGTKSTEELLEKNMEKAAKKREKLGVPAKEISHMATTSTKKVEPVKRQSTMTDEEREAALKKAAKYSKNAKPGSLSSKANMVSNFNSGKKED